MMIVMPGECLLLKSAICVRRLQIRTIVTLLVGFTLLCGFAVAHTPSDVEVTYNDLTGVLAVTITHQVENPATHYVKQVTVRQGTTVLTDTSYTSQPDRSSFTYNFSLPQLKGSTGEITVDVRCNQFGSRSGTLMLTSTLGASGTPGSSDTQPPTPLPTKAGPLPLVAILAVGFAARKIIP